MNLFQKQQNTSGYNSIPNAIATDDATAAAVPFGTTIRSTMMMTLGQRSKRMVAIAAGMLLVTGGAAVWLQEDGSYFRSSSGSLATEDGSITTDVMLAELGSETIALKEELALTLLDEQSSSARCTSENHDPWSTGNHVDCCSGLYEVWEGGPYRCESCQAKCEETYVDKKYACGPEKKTLVCYPTAGVTGQVPVVFYNRDSGGWDSHDLGNRNWLKKMAAQCLITIAPMTEEKYWDKDSKPYCENDHDSALAFKFFSKKENWEQLKIEDVTPDWTRIAAVGQSAGAHHLPGLQMHMGKYHNIRMKAVLYGHGGSPDTAIKYPTKTEIYRKDLDVCLNDSNPKPKGKWCDDVPTMFLTSTNDDTVNHASTYNWYQKLTGQKLGVKGNAVHVQKAVFAKVPGPHMEPAEKGVFNDYTVRFLACHLYEGSATGSKQSKLSQVACAWIYGDGTKEKPDICNSDAVEKLVAQKGGRHCFFPSRK